MVCNKDFIRFMFSEREYKQECSYWWINDPCMQWKPSEQIFLLLTNVTEALRACVFKFQFYFFAHKKYRLEVPVSHIQLCNFLDFFLTLLPLHARVIAPPIWTFLLILSLTEHWIPVRPWLQLVHYNRVSHKNTIAQLDTTDERRSWR